MEKTVIIYGDSGEKDLTKEIVRVCSENGGALVYDGHRVFSTSDDPFYLVLSSDRLTDISISDSIVVLGNESDILTGKTELTDCICVLDGDNKNAARFAAECGADTVGCSMSGHDTLTVSGFNDDGTMLVTLRRKIGRTEPGEYIAHRHEGKDIYPVLAAIAVIMLMNSE